ncbi:MAG: CHAT domain-containing protein [Deltaproteobacteria bacterium]|nr:CHAT domain-containing protein [Deltaproteobacteria bacterium]
MTWLTQTHFRLALVDVRLHGESKKDESGLSLAVTIRKLDPHVGIILLTAFMPGTVQVVRAVRYQGVANFIQKRDIKEASDLKTILEKVLDELGREKTSGLCQLSLSLEIGQPIVVRTRGVYVSAARTSGILELNLPRYLRRTEMARSDPAGFRFSIKGIGQDIYRDVFSSHRRVYNAFSAANARSKLLSLSFEASREFLGAPIELLYSDEAANYLSLLHPMSRFINGAVPQSEALSPETLSQLKGKLKILVITSDTRPSIALIDQIGEEVVSLLQKHDSIGVKLIPTNEATYATVRNELRQCPYHIVHYVGHGLFEENSPEQSSLFFWEGQNRSGNVLPLSGAELSLLLQGSDVRLFHLSCCEGMRTGTAIDLLDDDYLGIADGIMQAGVPSVLGFRWPVSVGGARKLALDFYSSFPKHGSPERALLDARRELAISTPDTPDWASPILVVQS